jgi:proline racemase
LIGGVKHNQGSTMTAKSEYAIADLKGYETFTHELCSPAPLAALILTEPTRPNTDAGMVIMKPDTRARMPLQGSMKESAHE